MEFRMLGSSDLNLSFIGLGTMNFGAVNDENECHKILDYYSANGGNFIDSANIYSKGNSNGKFHERGYSEQFIGSWLKKQSREKIFIATKVKENMGDGFAGLSKKAILFQADQSLRRLQTDYIDLYQAHGFDKTVPLDETLEAFSILKNEGKIRYYGCSNFYSSQLEEAFTTSRKLEISNFISVQNPYNLIIRHFLNQNINARYILSKDDYAHLQIGLITYAPFANGFLAGKYQKNRENEPSSRGNDEVIKKHCFNDKGWNLIDILTALSKKYQTTIGSIMLGWYKKCDFITTVLIGPRTIKQTTELLHKPDVCLSQDDFNLIDQNSDFSANNTQC